MKERPILFSAPMIRAILAGKKSQTRRVVKPQPSGYVENVYRPFPQEPNNWQGFGGDYIHWYGRCQYGQPGDQLVVAMEIPSVGSNYCAGSDGVIYSRSRGDWRPLKAHGNDNGYPCVTVMDGARKTTRAVHSLVCKAFYGEAPFSGAQVRHLDGDPRNSEPSNLAWGTQAENWRDRQCHGNGIEGEKHHAAKLSDAERAHVRWAIERGLCSQRHAARTLGMAQSAISLLMDGSETVQLTQEIPADRVPRIQLEITGIRVERLQDISEADALAEGIQAYSDGTYRDYNVPDDKVFDHYTFASPVDSYRTLWDTINGPGSWEANPWVWVIEFRRIKP